MKRLLSMLLVLTIVGAPVAAFSVGPIGSADAGMTTTQMRWYRARARMHSETNRMKGKTDYKERERRGRLIQRLQVRVERAEPNTTFAVLFNGEQIGELTTNAGGRGKLQMRTQGRRDNPNDDWEPLPPDFPTVIDGDEISVGDATGTFRVRD